MDDPSTRPSRSHAQLAALVAWTVFFAYFAAARGVHNLFPFSIFDMYRAHAPEVIARIMIVDEQGVASELFEWGNFHCEPHRPVLKDLQACAPDPEARPLGYVVRDQQLHLDEHLASAPGAEAIVIALRSYSLLDQAGAPPFTDCVIARCSGDRLP